MRKTTLFFLLATVLGAMQACACNGDKDTADTEGDTDADTDADTDTDADADADTDTDTDTDTDPLTGLLGREGEATVLAGSYEGWEDRYFIADSGDGDDLCRISYDVISTGSRDDCVNDAGAEPCDWAYDVEISGAYVETDVDGACAAQIGYDASTIDSLNGESFAIAYVSDYYGHANVLFYYDKGAWGPVANATYDSGSGAFAYIWVLGTAEY